MIGPAEIPLLFQFTSKQPRDFIDPNHVLIRVDEKLDFAKLIAPLEGYYFPDFGRPAIHHEVMMKALLACSLYNIASFNVPGDAAEGKVNRLGKETYERDIASSAEAGDHGEVVAINVDTGNWAIAGNVVVTTNRLRERRPARPMS